MPTSSPECPPWADLLWAAAQLTCACSQPPTCRSPKRVLVAVWLVFPNETLLCCESHEFSLLRGISTSFLTGEKRGAGPGLLLGHARGLHPVGTRCSASLGGHTKVTFCGEMQHFTTLTCRFHSLKLTLSSPNYQWFIFKAFFPSLF